jgi:hypothetical protein
MKSVRELLTDGRRAQRGSVLSGVLITTAFLAIIAGALMTELSTHFLISRALVNRVANEATVSSAMEMAIDQLQTTSLESGCPASSQVTENNRSAVASKSQCLQRRITITAGPTSWSSFNVDGTRVQIGGRDEYLVGDAAGVVYQYDFGKSTPNRLQLGGYVTGQPQAMLDPTSSANLLDLVPMHGPTRPATPACRSGECVAVLLELSGNAPQLLCYMATNGGAVTAQPAAGSRNFPNLVFFGDTTGTLWAFRPVDPAGAGEGKGCSAIGSTALAPGNESIVAGPVVIPCASCARPTDEIYVVTSLGPTSYLVHFTYAPSAGGLSYADRLPLPASDPKGIALSPSNSALAISFAAGQVAVAQIPASYSPWLSAIVNLQTAIGDAPYWCQGSCGDLIAVGGGNGLYLRDAALNPVGTYPTGGPAIGKTPGTDGAGNWFFAAHDGIDGYVYEVRQATMTLTKRYGPLGGQIGGSTVVGSCHSGATVCIYLGLQNNRPTIVPLDTRQAVFSACISTAPPACSGDNPRLWTRLEVGSAVSAQTVRVTGWSYYSP